ncbi:MAG: 3D domain-containing protein [Candidatus Moraniibacteriota bacterium]
MFKEFLMRNITILVILTVALVLPKLTLAAEQSKNDSVIAPKCENKQNTFNIQSISTEYTFAQIEQEKKVLPVVDERDEKLLSRWKEKQANQWNNLPTAKFTINASAYTAAADECGKSDGVTASGLVVQEKRTLACPPQFPFGAKIKIADHGIFTCEDRGGAIKGNKFDIYVKTKSEAFAFGRRNLEAELVF